MTTLIIEGDPLIIHELVNELTERRYLGSEFNVAIIEPDIPAFVGLMRKALDSIPDCAGLMTAEEQTAYKALEAIEATTNAALGWPHIT